MFDFKPRINERSKSLAVIAEQRKKDQQFQMPYANLNMSQLPFENQNIS